MAQLIPAALRRASLIIADSRYSAADVTARLDVPECRVRVVYPGIPEAGLAPSAPAERENVRRRLRLDGPYLLYVASFETRKNHATLVRAACRVREQGLAAKLVLVGRRGPQSAAIGRLIRRYALADRVIVPGYVKPAELHALYDGATATVYPSLYEGFGLPVVESMRRGVPAIAGDNTALAEVAGTAALMVDASSVDAIAEAVFRVLSDARLRAELVRRGRARAELFSWDKAARETTEVYRELGSGRSGPSANASSTRVGGVWHGNQRAGSGAGAGQPERHTCLPRAGGVPSVRGRRRSAGGAPRRGHEHLPVSPLRT
jgi:glycosyltransferase involved in cell wall biosynthesis